MGLREVAASEESRSRLAKVLGGFRKALGEQDQRSDFEGGPGAWLM